MFVRSNSPSKSTMGSLVSLLSLVSTFNSVSAQVVGFTSDAGTYSISAQLHPLEASAPGMRFEITAPASASWVGFGMGASMAGADMMLAWPDPSNTSNIILSRKTGVDGQGGKTVENAQVQDLVLLPGSGVADGKLTVAFVRPFETLPEDPPFDFVWAYSEEQFDGADANVIPPYHGPNNRGGFTSEFVVQAAAEELPGQESPVAGLAPSGVPSDGVAAAPSNLPADGVAAAGPAGAAEPTAATPDLPNGAAPIMEPTSEATSTPVSPTSGAFIETGRYFMYLLSVTTFMAGVFSFSLML
ncbi:hypothetical protein HK102_005085 [Quaeritorhiza haematococci]|nr:hypothetical protein HK102_005085 [Quaeritorhiza haematococci]